MAPRRFNERGVALLVVIWVTAALTVIAVEYLYSSRIEVNAVKNQKDRLSSYYLARGAVYVAIDEILRPYQYLLPADDGGVLFVRQGEKEPESREVSLRSGTAGGGKYLYQISDEESKMNLNRADRKKLVDLLAWAGVPPGVERDTIVDSILDWRDADDLHMLNGAEDDYYMGLKPPYRAKNGNLDSMGELMLVKGMTRRVLYGPEEADSQSDAKALADVATVWGEAPNYNTAPEAVLRAYLGEAKAQEIVNKRQSAPYTDNGKSFHFTVTATGAAEGGSATATVQAVIRRKQIQGKDPQAAVLLWRDIVTGRELKEHVQE